MSKLSVGQTISHAYGFLFRRFFAIAGLSWIPAALLGASVWYWMTKLGAEMTQTQAIPADTRLFYAFGSSAAMLIAVSFFAATIAVPLAQEAMGMRGESVAAHFVVGGRELRLFFAMLRFYALLIAAVFLFAAAVGYAARFTIARAHLTAAAWHGVSSTTLLAAGTAFLAFTLAIFLSLRLSFFLLPFAAAERHVGLARAWSLSRGRTWRLLLVSIALAFPIDILARAVEYALFGTEIHAATTLHSIYAVMGSHAAVLAVIGAITATVLLALFAGASSTAYRALLPERETVAVEHPAHEIAVIAPSPHMEPAFAKAPQQPVSGEAPPASIDHVETLAEPGDVASIEPAIVAPIPEEPIMQVAERPAHGPASEHADSEHEVDSAVPAADEAALPSHDPLPDTVVTAAPESSSAVLEASDSEAAAMATVPNRDADFDIMGTSHDDPFSFPLRAPETPPMQHDAAA